MNNPKKGEIWLVDWNPSRGSEQKGIRPSLVIQSNQGNLNTNYPNTIVLTISSKNKKTPFHIELCPNQKNNLNQKSYVKTEQILTISKKRLIKKIGEIDELTLIKVFESIKKVLDFN